MVAKNTTNAFWKDTLNCYSEFKEICRKNDTNEELIYHEVWYNIDIKVDRKCIFYKMWYDKGLRYIHDFLNDDGSFLNYETFCEKFNFNPPILRFYGVRDAILKRWPIIRNYNT